MPRGEEKSPERHPEAAQPVPGYPAGNKRVFHQHRSSSCRSEGSSELPEVLPATRRFGQRAAPGSPPGLKRQVPPRSPWGPTAPSLKGQRESRGRRGRAAPLRTPRCHQPGIEDAGNGENKYIF